MYHAHYNDVHPGLTQFDMLRYNYGYSFIDVNISVSKYLQRNIREVIKRDLEYLVIENCTFPYKKIDDVEKFRMYEHYGIPRDKLVYMYSGRVAPEKGVTQFLSAFKNLNGMKEICAVIVGGIFYSDNTENEYLKSLKEIAKQCTNPVIFTGYVEHKEMLKLWQVANIAVLPTYDVEEAAGLVVLEALMAGIPVIHTDSGGMGEYSNQECAVMIPRGKDFIRRLSDEMEHLGTDLELLENMRKGARRCSQQWSIRNYYCKLRDILNQETEGMI